MISIQFHVNKDQLLKAAEHRSQNIVTELNARTDKTFQIHLDAEVYDIRYEIDNQGEVQLFVISPENADNSLIIPDLSLNIGDLLLPESMALEDDGDGFNPDTEYTPYKVLGTNSLSNNKLHKILEKIKEIGFLNLVKK